MEYPYCIVDGVEYQLVFDERKTLRFPDVKSSCGDLNKLVMDYYADLIPLSDVWDEYTKTGSSYYMVCGLFTLHGMNNHTVTQGKGKCKEMILCSGNDEIDSQYNLSESDKIYYKLESVFENITTDFDSLSNNEIVDKLKECIKQIENRK